ncbi:PiggyBac transposable element-derived protein 4 [Plakobranchus ocellatus]|uniref:PiggyBac transposable element-derived protein 4 n=1 Tax=Plakobranchus ocellatus TaxID=259542 RepID=A0AAV3YF37_9GAST|nr:PiggyBac transposable element-derived protein 4 [Plakobranchus ocellatus]
MHGDKWKETDSTEIEEYVGCLLHMGVLKDSNFPTSVLWSKIDGNTLVKAFSSRDRFLKISNAMRFDDKETRTARKAKDIFAPFREIWEDFDAKFAREYVPGPLLTVDEKLMPWRGRCAFLQYRPSKPDKYGIKKMDFPYMVNHTREGKERLEKSIWEEILQLLLQNPILAVAEILLSTFFHRLHSQHTSVSYNITMVVAV